MLAALSDGIRSGKSLVEQPVALPHSGAELGTRAARRHTVADNLQRLRGALMHRVFISTNDMARPDYWLHHPTSAEDLGAMGEALKEGVAVTLHGPGGVELPAALRFQAEVNCWVAYPTRRPV